MNMNILTEFPAKFTHREHNSIFVLIRSNRQHISKQWVERLHAACFLGVRFQCTAYQLFGDINIWKIGTKVL